VAMKNNNAHSNSSSKKTMSSTKNESKRVLPISSSQKFL
jgi:hypothetical protein